MRSFIVAIVISPLGAVVLNSLRESVAVAFSTGPRAFDRIFMIGMSGSLASEGCRASPAESELP